jgi:7-carboxy-7-deazaguanine synthase
MSYAVKEIFYTLQGEGRQAGRAAVFCRFAGCNLWSGREADRASSACTFCDTDFVGLDGPGGASPTRTPSPPPSRRPGPGRPTTA